VTFSNQGPQDAAGVTRTVQLPSGLTGAATATTNPDGSSNNGVSVTGGGYYNATTGLVTYPSSPTTITTGSSLTSAISYTLASSASQVAATATVSTTTNEAGLTPNNTATAVMPAQFDLATTLTGPATTISGSPATLYVTTTNNGPNNAPVATQTITIPSDAQLTNVYITRGGVYTYNTNSKSGTVTFPDVANLPAGQTITNSVSFTAPAGNFAPSALVTLTSGDTNTANNTAYLNGNTTSTAVTVTGATTAMTNEALTISTGSAIVAPGAVVTYTVTATNKGFLNTTTVANVAAQVQLLAGLTMSSLTVGGTSGSLMGTTLTFTTPAGTTTYNTTTGVLTYPVLASQASGNTYTYDQLAVTVPANTGNNGQLLATTSVSTASSDPVPADNTASVAVKVQTAADLATSITGSTTTAAGQRASYTATFTNLGPGSATNVVETVQLPAGLGNVLVQDASGNVLTNAYNVTTGLVTLTPLANAPIGTSQTFGITFVAPGQSYVVSSTISSGTTDNATTNNSALLSATVSPTADVAVYVSGPATAVVGNAVTYAVTAVNNGPNTAIAAQATLQLPAGLSGSGPVVTNADGSSNNGVVLTSGGTYNATTGVATFPSANLAAGDSQVGVITFTMPASPTNGQIAATASISTSSTDLVAGNNTAALTTDIAPTTPDQADLVTTIATSTSPAGASSQVNYILTFSNNSPTTAASKVVPTAYLPAGLTAVVVRTSSGVVVPNAYNSTTGQITLPTIDSQPAGDATTYTVSLTAPANTAVVAASAVSSNTSDSNPANNIVSSTVTITPAYDVVTSLAGPTSAQPGSVGIYTVTTTNNGPSTSSSTANTTQTVKLPAGSVVSGLGAGASYNSGTGVITFPPITTQAAGANGAVVNSFTVQMPTTGNLDLTATVALSGESNPGNDQASLTTTPANQAPVAQNIWNTLQSPRGNTATQQLLSLFNAIDADGSIIRYTVTSLPDATQGVLYYNGDPVLAGQRFLVKDLTTNGLYFVPTPGFVGNATFTYTAIDNGAAVSNQALYTIPVAPDQNSIYTIYNSAKGGSNPYATNDVLAQVRDANTDTYNSTGVIYDELGVLQAGAANGLALSGTNAVITSGTLPSGVSLDPATGRIYVSDASQLPHITQATPYTVNVTVTDLNGGVSAMPVTFTIGAYPYPFPLPVELTAFTARAVQNRDALLTWTTASELNSASFDVERSLDGLSFAKVGQVVAQGTKLTATSYSFTEAGIGTKATGPIYYRLREVDQDGTAHYSATKTLSFSKDASLVLSLYPNPAQTTTTLDLSSLPATASYQVQLHDATGRQVLATTLAGGVPQLLDVASLASGAYHVLVTGTLPDGTLLRQVLRLTKE